MLRVLPTAQAPCRMGQAATGGVFASLRPNGATCGVLGCVCVCARVSVCAGCGVCCGFLAAPATQGRRTVWQRPLHVLSAAAAVAMSGHYLALQC